MSLTRELEHGLARLGVELPPGVPARLVAYLELLAKWNKTYNLTALADESAMVSHHLLDSLAVLPHLDRPGGALRSLADVGSGAGLPGIPLALARPTLPVTLIESKRNKAAFLRQAKIKCALSNVSIHCGRAEDWTTPSLFEAVIARAFAGLAQFVASAGHLLAPGGRLLAMKGHYPAAEAAALAPGWRITNSIPLTVPGLGAARHLLVIERA